MEHTLGMVCLASLGLLVGLTLGIVVIEYYLA